MSNWEYMVLDHGYHGDWEASLVKELNALGTIGWEAFTGVRSPDSRTMAVLLKRMAGGGASWEERTKTALGDLTGFPALPEPAGPIEEPEQPPEQMEAPAEVRPAEEPYMQRAVSADADDEEAAPEPKAKPKPKAKVPPRRKK